MQRLLSWLLPALSVAATVAFFVLLVGGAPLLSAPSGGRYESRAIAVALAILLGMLACVWIHGRLATLAERRTRSEDGG